MEKFLTGTMTALSVPILLLNLFGGIIGGIWLMIAGEWSIFVSGLLYMIFGATIIGFLLLPSLMFSAPAAAFIERKKYALFFVFGLFGILYTYGLIALSTYFVANTILSSESAPIWASLLWLYAVVLAPWQFMASKEQDNTSTTMTTFFLALGVLMIMILMGIFGVSLDGAFPVFIFILVASLLLQLAFTFFITREAKQNNVDEDIIDIEPEHKSNRTWGDLE